jgi:hypothetical protein
MENNIITFSADLTANVAERTISGKIVPTLQQAESYLKTAQSNCQKILKKSSC